MSDETQFRPGRRFTKRMLVLNNCGAWLALGFSLYLGVGTASIVVPSMSAFLFAMFGAYIGVGHLDMRASAAALASITPPIPGG